MGENFESNEQASFYKDLARLREKSPDSEVANYLEGLQENELRVLDEGLNMEGGSFYSFNALDAEEQARAVELLKKVLLENDLGARRMIIKQLP
jgi:hypothetical protein